jgi:hypothetical protein
MAGRRGRIPGWCAVDSQPREARGCAACRRAAPACCSRGYKGAGDTLGQHGATRGRHGGRHAPFDTRSGAAVMSRAPSTFRQQDVTRAVKAVARGSITHLDRINTECAGCGEPIQTVIGARKGRWNVCSNRCYQREYRKRRRGVQSVVERKAEDRPARCEACKQPIKRSRCDARFCSNRCRQWYYRRRKRPGAA